MEFTLLGRTGLQASVAGLGCGGHSRLGMARGESEDHAANVVRHALDLGINFIDTALAYGTEAAVGQGISGRRHELILSTKTPVRNRDGLLSGEDIKGNLESSLQALHTDYIDVFNLHGVTLPEYDHVKRDVLPVLLEARAQGKIRFLGVTERFNTDQRHEMLAHVLPDDHFDVVMVGFNFLNPGARDNVFPLTVENNVGTQIMFAVRRALASNEGIAEVVDSLLERNEIVEAAMENDKGFEFLSAHPEVKSLTEAAYRFCRHEPGADITLTGTGSRDHLTENVASILAPPLPAALLERLAAIVPGATSATAN